MNIITIEREFGSGASNIADQLAQRLGWKLWDRALTDEIAKLAQVDPKSVQRCDEHVDPLLYRLAKVFARGSYERALPITGPEAFDTDRMVALVQQVIESAAAQGNCVVVGRGAPWILRGRPDAFHVFIYARREDKIQRVRALGKTEEEAIEMVDTIDQERAAFIKRYYGQDWPTRALYDLMINSALGEDLVIDTIRNTMHAKASQNPGLGFNRTQKSPALA